MVGLHSACALFETPYSREEFQSIEMINLFSQLC